MTLIDALDRLGAKAGGTGVSMTISRRTSGEDGEPIVSLWVSLPNGLDFSIDTATTPEEAIEMAEKRLMDH